ncbi:DUF4113 domain-containing protein [Pseudarthrobacter sp. MDT3-1]
MLTDLRPAGASPQLPTFSTAHEATAPDWSMKRAALSPRYTTEWDEMLVVKAA